MTPPLSDDPPSPAFDDGVGDVARDDMVLLMVCLMSSTLFSLEEVGFET